VLYHEVAVALQAQPLAAHFDKTWGAHIGVKAGERATRSRTLFGSPVSACLVHCQVLVSLHARSHARVTMQMHFSTLTVRSLRRSC